MAKRPTQGYIPGTEPKVIPAVHKAIEDYVVVRDERLELQSQEKELKAQLKTALKKAGLDSYNIDGHEAHLEFDENVKAKLTERDPGGEG